MFNRRAERGLRSIRDGDPGGYRRVVAAIEGLAEDPLPQGTVKLKGFDPPAWRLRVGRGDGLRWWDDINRAAVERCAAETLYSRQTHGTTCFHW